MGKYIRPLFCLVLLLPGAVIGDGPNAVPYAESFETLAAGTSLAGTNGWSVSPGGYAAISNTASAGRFGYLYILSTNHNRSLAIHGFVTNTLTAPTSGTVLVEMVMPAFGHRVWFGGADGTPLMSVCCTNSGEFMIGHSYSNKGQQKIGLSVATNLVVDTGSWVRVSFEQNWNTGSPSGFRSSRVHVNGKALSAGWATVNPDGTGGANGTWFGMLTNSLQGMGAVWFEATNDAVFVEEMAVGTNAADFSLPSACTVTVSVIDANARETGCDPGLVRLSRDVFHTNSYACVRYSVAGTAVPGCDYIAPAGYVDMMPGDVSADIYIWPMESTSAVSRSVSVTVLTNSYCTTGDPSSGEVTIESNENLDRYRAMGPCSAFTDLTISEIMYNPLPGSDGGNAEFVEIYNASLVEVDMSGYRLSGDVDYTFPGGTWLPSRQALVVAADPGLFPGAAMVLGPFTGGLPDGGGVVRLRNRWDALLLEVVYDDAWPWPAAADGAGHSMILAAPDYGEEDPRAWSPSGHIGGSPGFIEAPATGALPGVVINEALAHTDPPLEDYVELFNYGSNVVDLSGCQLSDRPGAGLYTITNGTVLPPGQFLCYTAGQLGFNLSSAGDYVFLVNSNNDTVLSAISFGAQSNGQSFGYWPDGQGTPRALAQRTPAASNSAPFESDIVINEIMYQSVRGDDSDCYVELFNRGAEAMDLGAWRLAGGIAFLFPAGTVLGSSNYLVVARDMTNLLACHGHLNTTNTVGNYGGNLSGRGERVALVRPDNPAYPNENLVVMDEVAYSDGWGKWCDGGGSSLELIDPRSDNNLGMNWADSDESGKASWVAVDFTGRVDNANGAINRFMVYDAQAGEFLVDALEFEKVGEASNRVSNPGFESGLTGWTPSGSHVLSAVTTNWAWGGANSLHVKAACGGRSYVSTWKVRYDRVDIALNTAPVANDVCAIRARVRWLAGWPYAILGLSGHALEAVADMQVPRNLGTPGLQNSRFRDNCGPAISEVAHFPVTPAASENVRVTCRVADRDGIGDVSVKYRLDSLAPPSFSSATMTDDGAGADQFAGDGIYSGTIPGYGSGQIVTFHVEAVDSLAASNSYPSWDPVRDCVLRFGDARARTRSGEYALWMSATNIYMLDTAYYEEGNQPVAMTMIYNGLRPVYDAGVRYRGTGREAYTYQSGVHATFLPKSDRIMGQDEMKFDEPDQAYPNGTLQKERRTYSLGGHIGYASARSRYRRIYINGGGLVRDEIFPAGREFCERWYGADDPHVYKEEHPNEPFANYTTLGGGKKQSIYRYNMQKSPTARPDDSWDSIYALVDANTATNVTATYVARVGALVDAWTWACYFGCNGTFYNEDSYGQGQATIVGGSFHNMMAMFPPDGKSRLHLQDLDWTYGPATGLYPIRGIGVTMFARPAFRRVYLRALKALADGPMEPESCGRDLYTWQSALAADGYSAGNPVGMISFETGRRAVIYSQITTENGDLAFNLNAPSPTGSVVTVAGTAHVDVAEIRINGLPARLSFSSVPAWSTTLTLTNGDNVIAATAFDRFGNLLASDSETVNYAGACPSPDGRIVISEIMFRPAREHAEYVELCNTSPTNAFELGGWRINGIDLVFDHGAVIAPTSRVVVAQNIAVYQMTYSNAEVVVGEYAGTLDNGGETLTLLRPDGSGGWVEMDSVRYDDDPPWPAAAAGGGSSLQLVDPDEDNNRCGNWTAVPTNTGAWPYTPGWANTGTGDLPAFASVWINELMPTNDPASAIFDNQNEREPWVELYNSGTNDVDLGGGGYYLTDDATNLLKWAVPGGWSIASNGYLRIWLDAEPGETDVGHLHAGFRPDPATGLVALVRESGGIGLVVDYMTYGSAIGSMRSFGKYPDGEQYSGQVLENPTPGSANDNSLTLPAVSINEWMAANASTLADPADGDFDDWFELYNAGTNTVDLFNYMLTDTPGGTNMYVIPQNLFIAAKGYAIVWADGEPGQNGPGRDLHVDFRLSAGGDSIALYTPGGTLVDRADFGPQATDVGEGLWPNGTGDIYEMPIYTPGSSNVVFAITELTRHPATNDQVLIRWTTKPGKHYKIVYKNNMTNTTWTTLVDDIPAGSDSYWTNLPIAVTSRFFKVQQK